MTRPIPLPLFSIINVIIITITICLGSIQCTPVRETLRDGRIPGGPKAGLDHQMLSSRDNAEPLLRSEKLIKKTLPNGMDILLYPNSTAPVTAVQIWIKAGSADEEEHEAGLAHVHEHMMFKGTDKYGAGELAAAIEAAGGEINAWTSFDQTVYHVTIASRFFEQGLDILADAVINPKFDAQELDREKQVIIEEIKRLYDMPGRVLSQNLFATAYRHHPYRLPVIGTQETVQSFTRDHVLNFYNKWYRPDNMVTVIAGDFDPDRTMDLLKNTLGQFRADEKRFSKQEWSEKRTTRVNEKPQKEFRAIIKNETIAETYLSMAFHIPQLTHQDIAALDMLAVILGQGDSSRLIKEVRRKKELVTEAYCSTYTPQDAGLAIIGAIGPVEKIQDAYAALLEEAFRLHHEHVSADEILKARTILESDAVYQKETMQGMAQKFAYYHTVAGDTGFEDTYYRNVALVGPEDIRRVARQYLTSSNLSVSMLLPEVGEASPNAPAAPSLHPVALGELAREIEKRVEAEYGQAKVTVGKDAVIREVLPNGITLLVKHDPHVPVVAARAVFLGGLRNENEGNNGVSNLLADLLTKGTSTRSAQDISREVDGMAGSIRGFAGRNSIGLNANFLSRHFSRGLELFADCLLNSQLNNDELNKSRQIILEELKGQDDNMVSVAMRLFNKELYDEHPYSLDLLGTAESVNALSPVTVAAYYREIFTPENMTLAIVGDVDPQWVVGEVRRLFGDMGKQTASVSAHGKVAGEKTEAGKSGSPVPETIQWQAPDKPRLGFKYKEKNQAHIVLGFQGTTLSSADRYPLEVLSTILSGQGGRLFRELRDKQSLAYTVTSFASNGVDPGHFAVYMATSPENLDKAVNGILEQLLAVVESRVGEEELQRARQYMIGTQAISLQRTSARAALMALDEAYGLGYDFHYKYADQIMAVSLEDVQRVARKYIRLDAYTLAIVKPKDTPFELSETILKK